MSKKYTNVYVAFFIKGKTIKTRTIKCWERKNAHQKAVAMSDQVLPNSIVLLKYLRTEAPSGS